MEYSFMLHNKLILWDFNCSVKKKHLEIVKSEVFLAIFKLGGTAIQTLSELYVTVSPKYLWFLSLLLNLLDLLCSNSYSSLHFSFSLPTLSLYLSGERDSLRANGGNSKKHREIHLVLSSFHFLGCISSILLKTLAFTMATPKSWESSWFHYLTEWLKERPKHTT